MQMNSLTAIVKTAVWGAAVLLFGAGAIAARAQVNLTAGPASVSLPDGSSVPMWGYSCGGAIPNATGTCAALNSTAGGGWSPVIISVPTGQDLTIKLTNNLSFANGNSVPTSLTIVGQVGGGLGDVSQRTATKSPDHSGQQVTWPIAGTTDSSGNPITFTPPAQSDRVRSFATEVGAGTTTTLVWKAPRPGTYLLESGTHPSIQGPMGLYGIVVVASAAAPSAAGTAYPGVNYNADVSLLFSEIDAAQNKAVDKAVNTAGFSETAVWSGQAGGCGNPTSPTYNTCYPPAVNYTPLYYLINGVAFSRTNAAGSVFPASVGSANAPVTGNVLVRMVNAGLRMHVPSIVGSLTGTPATSGFSLIAEDGNRVPGLARVQNEVFMSAGKTFDVMVNVPSTPAAALPVYDRELSLSGNAIARDAGMLGYISVNGAAAPAVPSFGGAVANADSYSSIVPGQTLTVSDPSKGVIANDINVYGVQVVSPPAKGTLTLNANGTFTYVPNSGWTGGDSFVYEANGNSMITATVTLGAAAIESSSGIAMNDISYTSNMATFIKIPSPGVLSVDKDGAGYSLNVVTSSLTITPSGSKLAVNMDKSGGFTASAPGPGTYTFTYSAQNSQGTTSAATATVTLVFPQASGLNVSVVDGKTMQPLSGQDYRWIIEEDRTFYVDPKCQANPPPAGCPTAGLGIVPTLGVNFSTSHMPFVAQGCTGPKSCEAGQTVLGQPAVCDLGNGACRPDTTGQGFTPVLPSQVALDPTKRYYISVLPGDAGDPFTAGYSGDSCQNGTPASDSTASCGHGMGGAPILFPQKNASVTVLTQSAPYPPGKLSVMVFEDDFPLNGEQDTGGGVDVLATNEPGLGGFNLELVDQAGRFGDVTGQMTYDMFNQPLTNGLAGQIDPRTGQDACPLGKQDKDGISGQIVTCPKYESDGKTMSPLAGQAVIYNLMPGFYSVIATPGADRISRGEEWLQTNTLDGQKAMDAFIKIGEPSYFQEYGPAGYHDSIGFANPAVINSRHAGVCNGTDLNITGANCANSLHGRITGERLSRTPDERLYSSGSHDTFAFTQCYVSFGDSDGEDFAFTKCNADGTFTLTGLPDGVWRITVFDRWNDQIVDGLSTPVFLKGGVVTDIGDVAEQQWQQNVYTRTFIDDNKDGISQSSEAGIPLINTTVRFRDGSLANTSLTDFTGTTNFNETFPLFNWYVVETDTTRYKTTGIHTVYDAGGPTDGSPSCGNGTNGYPPCGNSVIAKFMANTAETNSLPAGLRVPGALYCKDADCSSHPKGIQEGPAASDPPSQCTNTNGQISCQTTLSTGRIDPPWVPAEGWQAFIGQNNFIEFGKAPYVAGENGGIHGHVVYASTRPFDDPQMLVQTQWEPLVPNVTMNLYKEGFAADGVTPTLTLVDTTQTTSWDDWAQGFRSDGIPNMNCPGQSTADLFYFTLQNQPSYLDWYNSQHGGSSATALPNNSQFKCYDGEHNWNQLQPAPYDGMYSFPSVTGIDPQSGKPTGTKCSICVANPDSTDTYRYGQPMLPAGKYVVEVIPPAGYEIVKEEDKNILIGDNFIAPAVQEFGGLGDIFILPDQAQIGSAYNPNNPQNPTQSLGANPNNQIVPGFVPEPVWPCVGEARVVPDFISLFPQSGEVAPFAGAKRNLCDRKEVTLGDQAGAIAKFYIFTSTHLASKFTGIITDDFTVEFDPFAPTFGEKFSPPNMPVSFKDWTGTEISRVYSDWWGTFNGLIFSTWEVNPPNPTGYAPNIMITCMNDPGPIPDPNNPGQTITDPLFNPYYSQFCYENPYMPGQTDYMDTPVVPTSAFVSAGYNNPDCAYPDATPAVKEADGDGAGPWIGVGSKSIASVTLSNSGIGYSSRPTVAINGGGTGATAVVNDLKLVSISLGSGGTNYTSAPTVSITGGGGSGAIATATINAATKVVTGIAVTNPGSGYTSRPTITISGGHGSGRSTNASATAVMGVDTINLTASGSGYTAPTVSFSGGGGTGASATAALGTSSQTLTITALGDQSVNNYAYSGPSATKPPYNQKTVTRHYGFGAQCSSPISGSTACNTLSSVTIGGKTATITHWDDTSITVNVPSGVPNCALQQQTLYGGSTAQCGQLVIIAGNGKQSIDAVTVTIGGKAPTRLQPGQTIQSALDAAAPGDLIMVPAGNYNELLIMWKPVRLQGVGPGSTIINANTHPAGKLDPWRHQVECLFGLSINGQPYTDSKGSNPYDSTGQTSCPGTAWQYFAGGPSNPQVDRIPLEGIVGWDTTVNGNLAELLQEPTLMGAYEGAGITVLGKGVNVPAGATDVFGQSAEADFPVGSTLLTAANCGGSGTSNPYPSNFQCNPSSIDGLSITDSSQGGGGIALHAWNHNMQISNNRIYNNAGTLSGGIVVGQGEYPDAYLAPNSSVTQPGSCQDSSIANTQLPYCFNLNVNVHNNMVTSNSSTGDELFTSTPAGAGGVTFCTGADYYKFNYNWVCGNVSTGDGGGVAQLGFSYNGDVEHNSILFNQSTNPTIPTNGGGLLVMGAPPDGNTIVNGVSIECGSVTDNDCVPGLSDGTGPGLVINANLIMGNAADSGSGGGLRFQAVNGADVPRFPNNPERWYGISVTNNIIADNVAGWDGAGVSLEDALSVNFINNTIVSNDTTASAGVLFNTLGAPMASTQSQPGQTSNANGTASLPQPAGIVTVQNSTQLASSLPGSVRCPDNHYAGTQRTNGTCVKFSYPYLANDVIWQNRAYYIGVGSMSSQYQQNVVSLYNAFSNTTAASQPSADASSGNGNGTIVSGGTGACITSGPNAPSYWDIGVRGDTAPNKHDSGITLAPTYSLLTDAADYSGLHNVGSNPTFLSQYCNGARVPPENGGLGYNVPPGMADATLPNPVFALTPGATVDEGNNWINMSWGPLSLTNDSGGSLAGTTLGNYSLASGSGAIDQVPTSAPTYGPAPNMDFFGNPRPASRGTAIDVGAVEFQGVNAGTTVLSVTPTSLAFGNVVRGTTGSAQTLTLHNTGAAGATSIAVSVTPPFSRPTTGGGSCGTTLAAGATCTINIVFSPTSTTAATGTVTITANAAVSGSPVPLTGSGVAAVIAASLTPGSWTVSQTRNCPGTGVGILACALDPAQTFTLTNTGNVPLTGVTQATLGGTAASLANYTIVRVASTCGPTGNGQVIANTTLAPGSSCNVTVQFKPLTSQSTGLKSATVSITDAAGSQTSNLNGTAQ